MIRIKPSNRNTNKHTPEGMELLENSIDKVGVIESISVAEDGTIISGHARNEIFTKKGMKPKEIELADDEFAVLKTKIKPNSKEYYEAQILANTTAKRNINLEDELIEEIVEEFDIEVEEVIGFPPNIDLTPIVLPDDFVEEFEKIKDAKYPIASEVYNCSELFLIPVYNKIDENFIRDIFNLNETKKSGLIKGKSNVINIELLRCKMK